MTRYRFDVCSSRFTLQLGDGLGRSNSEVEHNTRIVLLYCCTIALAQGASRHNANVALPDFGNNLCTFGSVEFMTM